MRAKWGIRQSRRVITTGCNTLSRVLVLVANNELTFTAGSIAEYRMHRLWLKVIELPVIVGSEVYHAIGIRI